MAAKEHVLNYDPEKNYDEDTMAQQREIEKEIAESQPLISAHFTFDGIIEEYTREDAVYRHKIEDLKKRYANMRKTRGDGNCFFRAFGFAYLETLLKDTADYQRFLGIAEKSKDELIALGFPQFTLEDFYDTFIDIVKQVENPGTVEKLLETFNDQGLSDYFVVYLRLLVSGYLQKNEDEYIPFIDGERTVKQFCMQEVEPMGKESDHIHAVALTKALQVPICIEYMDREGDKCNSFIFNPSDAADAPTPKPALTLLYRPGHFDILYPQ
ncbi:ubiquitin thioesterase OTUB1-like [Physella acuta]|uniref:ubiquitin thioesterase OTUB1-like n=1 Tax=Physella acuta TaxID=109671 RepID=UPI0027DB2DFE|nr:ubiquitin thioesterase OTUB1-like [Physella acuta]